MRIETTLDMTIPIWGLVCALFVGAFYIIKMKFDIDQLSKDLKEIKELMHEFILKEKIK